jgi:hypothetical protein
LNVAANDPIANGLPYAFREQDVPAIAGARCTFLSMAPPVPGHEHEGMARALERNTPWRAETDGQAVPPAVVCALNGSPPGRAAAAYAAALARALEWRLGLVASGLRPLELPMLAQAVIDEQAGVVVQPSERRGNADDAGELARRARVPVIVVPRAGWDQGPVHGPIVAVAAPGTSSVARLSTRLALALETTLQIMHADDLDAVARLVELAGSRATGLVVVGAEHAGSVSYRKLAVPVMFVPTEANTEAVMRRGLPGRLHPPDA